MIIDTPCGKIEGIELDNAYSYRGIRYAVCERFSYPEMIKSWEGTYNATRYGNCSYQKRAFYDEKLDEKKAFYYHEFREGEEYLYSDDCLFLNIWTPKNVTDMSLLPVIFYIHGGGFTGGCGHEKHFDGPEWIRQDVIAVTINYRLGPWGFMCLPELKEESGHTGNYGMYDQIAALKWVKENIKAFGGNPDNITIMGQSAGAMSVQQLCFSPLSRDLFSRAVMSSGAGTNSLLNVKKREEDYFSFWTKVKEKAGCKSLADFRNIDAKLLFDSFNQVKAEEKAGMVCFPVIDGYFLEKSSMEYAKNNEYAKVPYIAGSNKNDIMPPFFHKFAKDWIKRQDKESYCYYFNHDLPGDDKGAWHSSDLWYWFGTLKNAWRPFTKTDKAISDTMIKYLCNFAKTGNPNENDLPVWEPTSKNKNRLLIIDDKIVMGKPSILKMVVTMLKNPGVGE